MGLKPDFWIREMALEHTMIDPFTDGQVLQRGDLLRPFLVWI